MDFKKFISAVIILISCCLFAACKKQAEQELVKPESAVPTTTGNSVIDTKVCKAFYINITDDFDNATCKLSQGIIKGSAYFHYYNGCVKPATSTPCTGARIKATLQILGSNGQFVNTNYSTQFLSGSNFTLNYSNLPAFSKARVYYTLVSQGNCNIDGDISSYSASKVPTRVGYSDFVPAFTIAQKKITNGYTITVTINSRLDPNYIHYLFLLRPVDAQGKFIIVNGVASEEPNSRNWQYNLVNNKPTFVYSFSGNQINKRFKVMIGQTNACTNGWGEKNSNIIRPTW